MNSIRTMIVVTVLSAVGYGLYVSLNKPPTPATEPGSEAEAWSDAPMVEMPGAPGPPVVGPGVPDDTASSYAPPDVASAPVDVPADSTSPPFNEQAPAYDEQPPAYETQAPYEAQAPAYDASAAVPPAVGGAPPYGDPAQVNESRTAIDGSSPPSDGALPPLGSISSDNPVTSGSAAGVAGDLPAEPAVDFLSIMSGIQALLDQNRLADAQLELSRWYDDPRFNAAEQAQVLALLDQLTGTVVYSNEHLLDAPYTVQPGDTLEAIAERYQVPWQVLAKINGLNDPRQLPPGGSLKVVPGPFSGFVELSKFRLTLWLNGRYAGRFTIGVGPDLPASDGEFVVVGKVENPGYQAADLVVDANDPRNPLGEYWIDLGHRLGIHGTADPGNIGRTTDRGSIVLGPAEVQDVYDMLIAGSRVMIRR